MTLVVRESCRNRKNRNQFVEERREKIMFAAAIERTKNEPTYLALHKLKNRRQLNFKNCKCQ